MNNNNGLLDIYTCFKRSPVYPTKSDICKLQNLTFVKFQI